MRRGIVVSVAVILALCCLLSGVGGLAYLLWPTAVARPVVLIRSPRYGERVEVGERVTVHSIARDEGKVARVEFWADGQLQEAQTSSLPGGASPFPLRAQWQPLSPGTHTLTVRAFNPQGARAQASVSVEAFEIADRDGDGVADEADPCPDLAAPQAAGGCPDQDSDGIADYADACPDEAGLPEGEGCPVPSKGDGDGDGLLDYADSCPDEAGSPLADGCPDADGDGIGDPEDGCPDQPGPPENDGCPVPGDLDADGIVDGEDACPEEPGLPEHNGCPDSDGDGIPDADDACPDQPGLPEHDGCPDSDGDGIPDDIDPCPYQPGPAPGGCPPPGEGRDADEPPEGAVDFITPLIPQRFLGPGLVVPVVPNVEVEVLEFEVFDDYDEVYCYASLAGGDVERYGPFEPLGDRRWDIAEYLGGENSRRLYVPDDEDLEVRVECGAEAAILGERYPVDLGSSIRYHGRSEWDHDITVDSHPGPEGDFFQVTYRICTDSCEAAAFPPPFLYLSGHVWGETRLYWLWDGDPELITGFKVYVNDNYAFYVLRDRTYVNVRDFEPPCGERREFQITAYSGRHPLRPDRESPRSNIEVWEGPPCPRTVLVTFETLTTHELGGDEDSPAGLVGPIRADLGANEEWLSFDGASLGLWGQLSGMRLESHQEYGIEEMLQTIAGWIRSCDGWTCPRYYVPRDNYLMISLDTHDSLILEVVVYDMDKYWGEAGWMYRYQYPCETRDEIPADQITTGRHTARGDRCDLTVTIRDIVESGP